MNTVNNTKAINDTNPLDTSVSSTRIHDNLVSQRELRGGANVRMTDSVYQAPNNVNEPASAAPTNDQTGKPKKKNPKVVIDLGNEEL